MNKLIPVFLLLVLSPLLWAASPKPGSGHTHDGSVRPENESVASADGARRALSLSKASVSTTGNKKILVIRTQFKNYSFNTTYAKDSQVHDNDYYSDLLQGAVDSTVQKYYSQQSRGKLNLSFQVVGPYESNYGYAYYGENDDTTINENDKRPGTLVQEMLNKASGAADADLDNCAVIIIHAGPGEEEDRYNFSNYIWSHKSSLTNQSDKSKYKYEADLSPVNINGKVFDNYIIVPEYTISSKVATNAEATIGIICHEFGHILGLPDAYDTSYATAGVGQWSLMGGGEWGTMGRKGVASGADPAPFMAWELAKLGWITKKNITPSAGSSKYYEFNNINDSSVVYCVNLGNSQYLTLEGKTKNLSGSGMAVYETGLLITQVHDDIIEKYSSYNTINYGCYRPHGAMVVEAKASNYKTNGLGDLWRGSSDNYRITTTALFRNDTLTTLEPVEYSSESSFVFLPLFISTIISSGVVISILLLWYYGRKKLCIVIAIAAFVTCFGMSCVIEAREGGGGTHDNGPNTNYYTSLTSVYSKTGNSGITIYNIKCNEDGSGSFCIKKDK